MCLGSSVYCFQVVDWRSEQYIFVCTQADGIVVVGQDGVLHHLKAGTEIRRVTSRPQHNLEAWCVEVSHDRNLIVSGADDSLLLGWDLRSPDVLTFSNRSHEAGVISLACNPHNDFQILSGSYDERLRLFDLRHMKEPLIRSNRLGDGAYQLSWHTNKGVFAVAAMRCGFPIFELDEAGTFERLGGYCESAGEGCHGSLGYGISWQCLGHLSRSKSGSPGFPFEQADRFECDRVITVLVV